MTRTNQPPTFKYKICCYECDKMLHSNDRIEIREFQSEHYKTCGKHPEIEFL